MLEIDVNVCLFVILKQFKVKLADITSSIVFDVRRFQTEDTVVYPYACFDFFINMDSFKVRSLSTLLSGLKEEPILC